MESAPTPATSNSTSTSDASEGSSNQPNRINLSAQQLLAHEDDDQLMPIMHALGWMAWDLVDGFREYVKFPAHGDRNKVNIVKLTSPVHFATKQDRQEVFREMRTFTQLLGEVGDGSELRIKLVKEPGLRNRPQIWQLDRTNQSIWKLTSADAQLCRKQHEKEKN
ncbi:hypothetical protein O6H91_06G068900 [Diphasiastrum complanatum]|uniref:Uncharacterized protein n=1 Tax=Diphasiastrum complanatum TaxID=34168 RepID=A0ACC2DEJ3_DIPCM|nr:hypothetical protein O6H91_06G068900 [Diphasiastrum complanatum]